MIIDLSPRSKHHIQCTLKNLAPSISYCSCWDCLLLLQLQATHPVMSISICSLSMCSRQFKISLCALWCFLWLCITFHCWHLLLLPSPIWTDPCPDLLGTQCWLQSRGVHDSRWLPLATSNPGSWCTNIGFSKHRITPYYNSLWSTCDWIFLIGLSYRWYFSFPTPCWPGPSTEPYPQPLLSVIYTPLPF